MDPQASKDLDLKFIIIFVIFTGGFALIFSSIAIAEKCIKLLLFSS